ncbi:MAG: hypothetical protein IT449_13805 [Phycisphaerales bacterium]|nr:hypothetical protein [Phycisphaerales bacterium]
MNPQRGGYGRWRALWLLSVLLLVLAARAEDAKPLRFEQEGATARFAAVLSAVQASPAPALIGIDAWNAWVEQHRPGIEQSATHAEFARRLNELFHATGQSHFEYETDEEFGYWHLLSAFYRTPDTHVEHVGLFPQQIDGRWYVRGILEGSSAEKLDLRVGDELVSVNGQAYSPVKAFAGLSGRQVPLVVRRAPGSEHTITVAPVRESLADAVDRAMDRSVAFIPHQGGFFAYAHIWMMLGDGREYQELLAIQDKVDGLILDFRDGVGGTPMHGRQFLLGKDEGNSPPDGRGGSESRSTLDGSESRSTPSGSESRSTLGGSQGRSTLKTWTKPVVILIADGTRSAKELLVHDAREAGRAVLVGTPTPGHVTAVGGMPRIGADAVLILPGFRFALEGKPTQPDVLVERDLRHAAGRDPQLDRAVEVLGQLVRQRKGPTGP